MAEQTDRLWARLRREKGPRLSDDVIEAIEHFVEHSCPERRTALAYLRRPWSKTMLLMKGDRETAGAFAAAALAIEFKAARYREIAYLMDAASTRMRVAL